MQLQEFAKNIWFADGSPVNSIGPLKHATRMIIVRLSDGALWINSPITASENAMHLVEQLGPIRYLLAPSRFHVWRLESWKAAFPKAELWGPPGLGKMVDGVSFDQILGETPPSTWAAELDQMVFRCNPLFDEVEFLHRASRTLMVGDYIQEPRSPVSYLTRSLVQFSRPRRSMGRRSREALLTWDFDGLILAHGPCINHEARPYVERALDWL